MVLLRTANEALLGHLALLVRRIQRAGLLGKRHWDARLIVNRLSEQILGSSTLRERMWLRQLHGRHRLRGNIPVLLRFWVVWQRVLVGRLGRTELACEVLLLELLSL